MEHIFFLLFIDFFFFKQFLYTLKVKHIQSAAILCHLVD